MNGEDRWRLQGFENVDPDAAGFCARGLIDSEQFLPKGGFFPGQSLEADDEME